MRRLKLLQKKQERCRKPIYMLQLFKESKLHRIAQFDFNKHCFEFLKIDSLPIFKAEGNLLKKGKYIA